MGTRGLTVVIDENSDIKVAQYGQWDFYPSGQGLAALNFLRDSEKVANLKANLSKCRFISDNEHIDIVNHVADSFGGMSLEASEEFGKLYPSLIRDTGADILDVIANADKEIPLIDNTDFANDEIFCEGVYTINFATNTFTAFFGDKQKQFHLDGLPTDEEFLNAMGDNLVLG